MEHTKEIRSITTELRFAEESDKPRTIVGYAAKYESPSEPMFHKVYGPYHEIIRRGAFTESLANNDKIACLFNHDTSQLLGKNTSGTLVVSEDETGLAISLTPPDTQLGKDIQELITRGDLSQMSFGFIAEETNWTEDDQGNVVRELLKVKLFDVSIVTFPQYEDTEVSLRGLEEFKATKQPVRRSTMNYRKILLASAT